MRPHVHVGADLRARAEVLGKILSFTTSFMQCAKRGEHHVCHSPVGLCSQSKPWLKWGLGQTHLPALKKLLDFVEIELVRLVKAPRQ